MAWRPRSAVRPEPRAGGRPVGLTREQPQARKNSCPARVSSNQVSRLRARLYARAGPCLAVAWLRIAKRAARLVRLVLSAGQVPLRSVAAYFFQGRSISNG